MKTLRYLLAVSALLLLLPEGARAQSTPTYRSFNTNQFYTNGSAPVKINVITNWPALVITNIYSSNIYVTNIYASNIVSGDIIWTNAGPYITPLPFTNTFQITTNGAVLSGKSVWPWWNPDADDALISVSDIAQGETGARKIYIAGVDDAASPTNYSSFRAQAIGGASPSGQINLASTLNGITSRLTINVQPGANVANIQLYNNGNLNFAVNDSSGYSGTGTNFLSDDGTYKPGTGTTINPTDTFIPYRFDGATFEDSPMYRIDANTVGVDTVDANTLAATNLQSGGVVVSDTSGILTNLFSGTGFLQNDGANTLSWSTNAAVVQLGPFTPGRYPIATGTNTLGDGSFYASGTTNVALDVPIVFGPGTTNLLYRSGSDLVYTNGATTPRFTVSNASGSTASIGLNTGASAEIDSSSGFLYLADNTIFQGNLLPDTENTRNLGSPASVGAFHDSYFKGTHYVEGYNVAGSDYSRLALNHTGTNGAIVFDSQSAGTAGVIGRPFVFTNAMTFSRLNTPGVLGYLSQFFFIHTNIYAGNLSSGDSDIYTVPASKRFLVQQCLIATTNTAGSTAYSEIKTNSIYYRAASNSSITTNQSTFVNPAIVLESGESFSVNTSSAGVNVVLLGLLYDNTVPIYSPRIMSLTTGNDVVYTCPANTFSSGLGFLEGLSQGATPGVQYVNASGSDRSVAMHQVPSGGSVLPSNRLSWQARTNLTRSNINTASMMPGDSVVLISDAATATQWAWVTVVEIPY